jgi:integrase
MAGEKNEVLRAQIMRGLMAARTSSPALRKPGGPPPLPQKLVEAAVEAETEKRLEQARTSKRLDLSKLPKTWRSQVFEQVKPEKQSRLASSVALLWATGCRPVEIEKGVQVKLEAGVLVVEIRGAKTGPIPVMTPFDSNGKSEIIAGDRGLEWRRIKLNPKLNAATEYLARLCVDGQAHTVDYNKNSLRTRLNEAGKLAIKKLPDEVTISPYTFRHALGSDLKSCDDYSDEEKSQVMGHLSCDSLSVYGRRRHRGGVKPVLSVEASAVPRGEYTDARSMPKKHKLKKP